MQFLKPRSHPNTAPTQLRLRCERTEAAGYKVSSTARCRWWINVQFFASSLVILKLTPIRAAAGYRWLNLVQVVLAQVLSV